MWFCSEAGNRESGFGIRNSEARLLIFRFPNPHSRFPSGARGARA